MSGVRQPCQRCDRGDVRNPEDRRLRRDYIYSYFKMRNRTYLEDGHERRDQNNEIYEDRKSRRVFRFGRRPNRRYEKYTKIENQNNQKNDLGKWGINDENRATNNYITADIMSSNIIYFSLRTAGAYIPPSKLRITAKKLPHKSSIGYQRIAWEALKKSIHGLINKVNTSNIAIIAKNLFKQDIVRGRGLLCSSLLKAQAASMKFTNVYAALVAIINSKFPNIGELLIFRCLNNFKNSYRRGDKTSCSASAIFIAHLVNQNVIHEITVLEILRILLANTTSDSVEVAIESLKECGEHLRHVSPGGLCSVFDTLCKISQEGDLSIRIQHMIEVMHQIRKNRFKDYPAIIKELDLIKKDDQFTHFTSIDDTFDGQEFLNVFRHDPEYEANENKYKASRAEILGDESDDDDDGDDDDEENDKDSDDPEEGSDKDGESSRNLIKDEIETDLVAFRRTVYLTISSSSDVEKCAHKLLQMQMKPDEEIELCRMFLDCSAQQKTYEKFYGLLAQRLCQINQIYVEPLKELFINSYQTSHRLDITKLRKFAKFFAQLLYSDAIPWTVLSVIRLNKEDTTPSGRVFIKTLFLEFSEFMGLPKLHSQILNPELQEAFEGLFPKDNPKNTRFAINFFTLIGLAGLTHELRDWLKNGIENQPAVSVEAITEVTKNRKRSVSVSSTSLPSTSSSSPKRRAEMEL